MNFDSLWNYAMKEKSQKALGYPQNLFSVPNVQEQCVSGDTLFGRETWRVVDSIALRGKK